MKESKRAWDFLSDDERRIAIQAIVDHFATERDEVIGIIAAQGLLDFFLQTIGGAVYNKAVDDTKAILSKEFEDTLLNLDVSLRK